MMKNVESITVAVGVVTGACTPSSFETFGTLKLDAVLQIQDSDINVAER